MNKKIKNHIYEIIFEADTKPGELFDIITYDGNPFQHFCGYS